MLGDTPAGRLHKSLVVPGKAASVFQAGLQIFDPGMAVFGGAGA